MIGHSLGGALSLIMASAAPEKFKGVSLIAPFFDYNDPEKIRNLIPYAKLANIIAPTYSFKIPIPEKYKHNSHFFEDKLFKGEKICAHNVIISDSCLKRMNEEYIPKFSSPLLTIECGMDKQVSNKAIRSFYEKCKSIDKTIINYDEVDHNI